MRVPYVVSVELIACIVCTHVLARPMIWTIVHRGYRRIVRKQLFIVSGCVGFVSFASSVNLAESLFAPECQSHQSRHVKSGDSSSRKAGGPKDHSAGKDARRECLPQNLVF